MPTVSKWQIILPNKVNLNRVRSRVNQCKTDKDHHLPNPKLMLNNKPKRNLRINSKCSNSRSYSKLRLRHKVMQPRLLSKRIRLKPNIRLRLLRSTLGLSVRLKRGTSSLCHIDVRLMNRPNGNAPDQDQNQPNSAGVSHILSGRDGTDDSLAILEIVEMEIHRLNENECERTQVVPLPRHSQRMGCNPVQRLSRCISSNSSRCRWLKLRLSRMILRYALSSLNMD
jgi:hypothetical protein